MNTHHPPILDACRSSGGPVETGLCLELRLTEVACILQTATPPPTARHNEGKIFGSRLSVRYRTADMREDPRPNGKREWGQAASPAECGLGVLRRIFAYTKEDLAATFHALYGKFQPRLKIQGGQYIGRSVS